MIPSTSGLSYPPRNNSSTYPPKINKQTLSAQLVNGLGHSLVFSDTVAKPGDSWALNFILNGNSVTSAFMSSKGPRDSTRLSNLTNKVTGKGSFTLPAVSLSICFVQGRDWCLSNCEPSPSRMHRAPSASLHFVVPLNQKGIVSFSAEYSN